MRASLFFLEILNVELHFLLFYFSSWVTIGVYLVAMLPQMRMDTAGNNFFFCPHASFPLHIISLFPIGLTTTKTIV